VITAVPTIQANTLAVQPASMPPVSQRQRSRTCGARTATRALAGCVIASTRARNAGDAVK
jgi:hypothetical protein